MNFEIRTSTKVELEGRKLYGTVIPYNSLSLDLGGFKERFLPGSITETIKSGQIESWYLHDNTKPLGSQAGGSLRLFEDAQGLHYENDIPDTSYAKDMIALMSNGRKDIGGTSFGFRPTGTDGQRWLRGDDKMNIREILKADINHISPVITPAYPETSSHLRSIIGVGNEEQLMEYGIDIRALQKIFLAVDKGFIITNDEMELARQAIGLLRSAIRKPKLEVAADRASGVLL